MGDFMKRLMIILIAIAMLATLIGGALTASADTDVSVTVDGRKVVFPDAKPFIDENGRTLIPVRFVTEDLGATVEWNAEDREVYITKDKSNVLIRIGQERILVNGITKTMDTKAIIRYDRTYVPIRYVAEGLGATVGWDAGTRTVIITTIKDVDPTPIPTLTPSATPEKDPVTGWITVKEDLTWVEYSMSINWTVDNELLNKRYDAAEKMFAERYGEDIAKEIFAYVRLKQTRPYVLEYKRFKMNNQFITVSGKGAGLDIKVWKEGVILK
ncbi:Protease inhibitor precursor [Acetivibrio saccincola]|uniref:Protease inhibitor n=2 Tax=Acetivibrio saccincola TaxID=1677857 RepID=A0A2K9EBV4_9FIRM|nr:Protease inhibitor precursor [Acetivibrio saccincola]